MIKVIFSTLAIFFAAVFPASAYFEQINEFYLDNKLQVIVIENHKAPIIKQMLIYKTGAVDEELGKGGLAHLLEHLMFRGTKKISGNQFNDLMEKNGAISNAFTSQDITAYHQFLSLDKLELAMFAEADRMTGLLIKKDDFTTEQQIVLQERKQRIDNEPTSKFYEIIKKTFWQNHPYARQITGEESEIINLSQNDALDFYKKYYTPNNAVLVLAGDIDVATAKELAQKYYGSIKSGSPIETKQFPILPQNYKSTVQMELDDIKLSRIIQIYGVPSFNYNKEQVYAYSVLAEYLGGDKNSPFYQKLVLKDKKAISLNVGYNPISRSMGVFEIIIIPVDNHDNNYLLWSKKAFNYAISQLDENKLNNTKQKILADLAYLEDSPNDIAMMVGNMAAVNIDIKELHNYEANISKVTLEEVKQAAQYLQSVAPQVSGILYPKKEQTDEQ